MDYLEQQFVIVCELCAGGHYTHQCVYNRNQPNFDWSYNQSGMQQSHQSSYPFQNQQYGTEPYNPSEMQQQQEQQFQYPYEPVHQQFQPLGFQQQQFHTDYDHQPTEASELEELKEELRLMADSQKRLADQMGQIADALRKEHEQAITLRDLEAEQEDNNIPINLDWPFLARSLPMIVVQKEEPTVRVQDQIVTSNVFKAIQIPSEDEDCFSVEMVDTEHSKEVDQLLKSDPAESAFRGESDTEDEDIADLEAEKEEDANRPENSEIPENSENSVLKNQPQPHSLESENSEKSAQNQEKAKAQVYPPSPYPQHIEMLITIPWQRRFKIPHESLGLADLWNSQVRLKPPCKEAPILELKSLPDLLRYAYLNESSTYPVIIASNLSGSEEDKLLRILRVEQHGKLYPIMKEVVEEEIIKWPLSTNEKLVKFRHQTHVNSKPYKECVKKKNDRQLAYKTLYPP